MKDLHRINRSHYTLGLNEFAHAVRAEHQDQHTTCKICQAALQREPDSQTCSTNHGHKGGRGNANHGSHTDGEQYFENNIGQAAYETEQLGINATSP